MQGQGGSRVQGTQAIQCRARRMQEWWEGVGSELDRYECIEGTGWVGARCALLVTERRGSLAS